MVKKKKKATNINSDTVASPYGHNHGYDKVTRNIDVLLNLHRRRGISLEQYQAGLDYVWAYTTHQGQTNAGIDYSRQKVDTSGPVETLSEKQCRASDMIRNINKVLDYEQRYILQKVVGENWDITYYALMRHGLTKRSDVRKQKAKLVESLDLLAHVLGYSVRSRSRQKNRFTGEAA